MKLSVDTNAYRAFVDGEPAFVEAIRLARTISFSVIVLGELRAGFANGRRGAENERILSEVLAISRVEIQTVADSTSAIYARVWSDLRKRGVPIPTNDVWIAAQCLEDDLTLLTRDAHFRNVAGLQVLPAPITI